MTCKEFQQILPEIMDGPRGAEHEAHLTACPACSSIVADLAVIAQSARQLRAAEEPSPRVWNSIEIALREQGLVRQPAPALSIVSRPASRWSPAWLVPVAAAVVVAFGLMLRNTDSPRQEAGTASSPAIVASNIRPASDLGPAIGGEDAQLLEAVSSLAPAMRSTYEASLMDVNAYIRDAETSARENPGDDEAQQVLIQAYEQRNMIYDMALDRSLR